MDNNNDDLVEYFMESPKEITDKQVEYFRKNPQELDLLIDKEIVHFKFMRNYFLIAVIIIIGTKIVSYFLSNLGLQFIYDVIVDVISEIGIALLGGVVTVFFLEVLQKKQYEENIKYRAEIIKRIRAIDKK